MMCGTTGGFYNQGNAEIQVILRKLRHCGPDGKGIQELPFGTQDHNCLAIIEIEGGYQSMNIGNARIVFNGEMYNNHELAHEHLSDQLPETHSDMEVIKYGTK